MVSFKLFQLTDRDEFRHDGDAVSWEEEEEEEEEEKRWWVLQEQEDYTNIVWISKHLGKRVGQFGNNNKKQKTIRERERERERVGDCC